MRDVIIKVDLRRAPSGGQPFPRTVRRRVPAVKPEGGAQPADHRKVAGARLRRELLATKEYLQSIVEENATTVAAAPGGHRRGAGGQ